MRRITVFPRGRTPPPLVRVLALVAIWLAAPALGSPLAGQDLPFDPPAPHPSLERLGSLDGIFHACSVRFGEDDAVVHVQPFRVEIRPKVFGQAVAVDLLGADPDSDRNPQASLLVYARKDDSLHDVTASAIGAVEYWDEDETRDGEVLAFALRDKARFVVGDDPAQLLNFRKVYLEIEPVGYVMEYHISADDGGTWRTLFREVGRRGDGGTAECSETGEPSA